MRRTPGTPGHVWVNVTGDPRWARPGLLLTQREVGARTEAWVVTAAVERPSGTLRVREGWTRSEHLSDSGPPPAPRAPRHVMVRLGPDSLDVHPGLLLFWWGLPAVGGAQWLAWVVWASGGGHHEVEAHQGWLPAGQVRPVVTGVGARGGGR
ncbi:hypothetical protein [Nocardioides sp. URHA0032]|uniref:hypothetical protein n=1 Tax=Nocardioides sp. URHA0032 TaxID=1380388 RepID=UPI0012DD97DE|nr:hypothetical protein [Nocardioides sp. URHA0032]